MKSNSNYLFNLLIVFISIISSINLYSSSDEVVSPPNILLIICDDLNTDIEGWGGHPQTITPNISRLMDGAINFKQAHCTIPICAPSRSSFLTGIYPHNSNNFAFDQWKKNPTLSQSKSLSRYFKDNGYFTLGTGKIMHHLVRSEWDVFFQESDYGPYAFDGEENRPHPLVPKPFRDDFGRIDGSFGPLMNLKDKTFGGKEYSWKSGNWVRMYPLGYETDDLRDPTADEQNTQWVIEQLNDLSQKNTKKPFFMALGLMRPHTPLIVPQKYFDLFPLESIKIPEILEDDAADTFLLDSRGGNDRGRRMFNSLVASYDTKELALKQFIQAYLACVASVDDLVGQILDKLDSTKLSENTIVVFTSDHGWGNGPKDYVYKNSLWEESTRVPLIIRVPEHAQKGVECEHPVSLIDLYPTLLELCGLSSDNRISKEGHLLDGYSLVPFIKSPENPVWNGPDSALTAIHKWKEKDPFEQSYSLRSKDWRYIRYHTGKEELYDKSNDVLEWTNLAYNTEYRNQIIEFRKKLDERLK